MIKCKVEPIKGVRNLNIVSDRVNLIHSRLSTNERVGRNEPGAEDQWEGRA